jgi:pyridoxal/pyridoxine/pyridoxamine kinase
MHVAHADCEVKFWLAPQVVLTNHTGLSATHIRQAQAVLKAHLKEILDAWNHRFGG